MSAEQLSYRFRNDDGSETTATWKAAENAAISSLVRSNLRVRMLLDTVGTFSGGSVVPTLLYKKSSESAWRRPNLEGAFTLTYNAAGVVDVGTAGPVVPTLPASTDVGRSLLILVVWQKPTTANGGTVTTPTGWTLAGTSLAGGGYAGTTGIDVGNTNVHIFWKVSDTVEASTSVTVGDNNVCAARIFGFTATVEGSYSIAVASGEDTVGDASFSVTAGTDPGVVSGDFVMVFAAVASDAATFATHTLTQTGVTYGAVTELQNSATTSGNDLRYLGAMASATAGTSGAAPVFGSTAGGTTTNARGACAFVRVRGSAYQRCVIVASSNFANGSTTFQMTPPAGKATSDFAGGKITETDSTTLSTTIPADDYGEWEWNLQFTELALAGDIYQFRMMDGVFATNGLLLDTYTQTPQVTILSGALNAPQIFFMG